MPRIEQKSKRRRQTLSLAKLQSRREKKRGLADCSNNNCEPDERVIHKVLLRPQQQEALFFATDNNSRQFLVRTTSISEDLARFGWRTMISPTTLQFSTHYNDSFIQPATINAVIQHPVYFILVVERGKLSVKPPPPSTTASTAFWPVIMQPLPTG